MTAVKPKTEHIDIKIKDISLLSYKLSNLVFTNISEQDKVSFKVDVGYSFNVDEELIHVICNVQAIHNENEIASMETGVTFEIKELRQFLKDDKTIDVPNEVLHTINSITYSTTRGVWYSTMKGSVIEKFVLPLIDPSTFFKRKKSKN